MLRYYIYIYLIEKHPLGEHEQYACPLLIARTRARIRVERGGFHRIQYIHQRRCAPTHVRYLHELLWLYGDYCGYCQSNCQAVAFEIYIHAVRLVIILQSYVWNVCTHRSCIPTRPTCARRPCFFLLLLSSLPRTYVSNPEYGFMTALLHQ